MDVCEKERIEKDSSSSSMSSDDCEDDQEASQSHSKSQMSHKRIRKVCVCTGIR